KRPVFLGSLGEVSDHVRQRMMEILARPPEMKYLPPDAVQRLEEASSAAHQAGIAVRGIWSAGDDATFIFTWTGTRVHQTLKAALTRLGFNIRDHEVAMACAASTDDVAAALKSL